MDNNVDFTKNIKRLSYFLLSLTVFLFVFSLVDRKIDIDDGMIGEHAYWLAKEGKVKSNLFWGNGIGWEEEQYHYHKLFVAIGALFIEIFGFSLPVLKSISLLFLVLFSGWLMNFIKKSYPDHVFRTAVFFFIFLSNANTFYFSFVYRPELMTMTLGFISFFFLYTALNNNSRRRSFASGAFAGLATLTHLNGLIFIFASVLFLVKNKKYTFIFPFLIFSSIVMAFYFFNINSYDEFQSYWYQFRNDPALSKEDFTWFQPIIKITQEHKRFFHSPREVAFSILFLVSLFFAYKSYGKNEKYVLQYLLFLVLGLAGLAHGTTSKYSILYYPFMTLLIVYCFFYILNRKKEMVKQVVFFTVVLLYLVVETVYNFRVINERFDIRDRNELIGNLMEKGASVYANEYFVFDEIKNFTIKSSLPLGFQRGFKEKSSDYRRKKYFELAKKGSNDYIVIDTFHRNSFYNNMIKGLELNLGDELYGYKVIHNSNGIYVFKRLSSALTP